MYYPEKLKRDTSIAGFIPAILCLSIGAILSILFGIRYGFISISLFFVLYAGFSMVVYFRIKNLSYLVSAAWQFLIGFFLAAHPVSRLIIIRDSRVEGLLFFILLVVTIWLFYLVFNRKAKWKGREVFELASLPIDTSLNGFTERPRPSGSTEYTMNQLKGFAEFLRRNLIAMPFAEETKIVLVPVRMGDEFNFIFHSAKFRQTRTWIAFDFQGNVTVNISKKDYLYYREELTFDQLCENLGKLFIDFMEYYKNGEAARIIYRLDELKVSLTS
jgi:hypothetical protein